MPSEASRASMEESSRSPRMWECVLIRLIHVRLQLSDSRLSSTMATTRRRFCALPFGRGGCGGASARGEVESVEMGERLPDPAGVEKQGRSHAPNGASPDTSARPAA
jgi:hypothetical protein